VQIITLHESDQWKIESKQVNRIKTGAVCGVILSEVLISAPKLGGGENVNEIITAGTVFGSQSRISLVLQCSVGLELHRTS